MVKQFLWGFAALWAGCASAQVPAPVPPVIKVGDVAVYSVTLRADKKTVDETVTVTAVNAGQITSRHARPDWNPAEREGITTVDNALVLSAASGNRFEPPIALTQSPMAVGTSWKSSYEAVGANARSRSDTEFKVVAMEKLTTPAGAFDTFKIESSGWITGVSWQGSVRFAQVLWFAPALGRFVKTEYKDFRGGQLWSDTLTELKSFKPAP